MWYPFFQLFQLVIDQELRNWSCVENSSWWKMSDGQKRCSQECLWVENSLCPKMSAFGKYLKVENTSWWKMLGGPICVRKWIKTLPRLQPIQLLPIFFIEKDKNKRHEYTHKFARFKVIVYKSCGELSLLVQKILPRIWPMKLLPFIFCKKTRKIKGSTPWLGKIFYARKMRALNGQWFHI